MLGPLACMYLAAGVAVIALARGNGDLGARFTRAGMSVMPPTSPAHEAAAIAVVVLVWPWFVFLLWVLTEAEQESAGAVPSWPMRQVARFLLWRRGGRLIVCPGCGRCGAWPRNQSLAMMPRCTWCGGHPVLADGEEPICECDIDAEFIDDEERHA